MLYGAAEKRVFMYGKLFLRLILSVVFLVSFFCIAPVLQSCSEGPDPFSDFSSHPDDPLEKFAAGQLGIVQPTFARSYLVVAYRYFAGAPLTKDEQWGAEAIWSDRIGDSNVTDQEALATSPKNPYVEDHAAYGRENWPEARKQVTDSPAPEVAATKDGPNYNVYVNCGDDALETAAITLKARVKTFGKDNPGVKDWLKAQDTVFTNCGDSKEAALPDAPSAWLPETLRFDREYQIAAARMYAGQFDEAGNAFERIASEEKSPWRQIAPYLVARNLVRRASLEPPVAPNSQDVRGFDAARLRQAETKIQSLLRDPSQKFMQASLQALLDRLEFRLNPKVQTAVVSQRLRTHAPDGKFYQWLCDYTLLLDQRLDSLPGEAFQPGETNAQAYADATPDRAKDDLTDWIVTFQANNGSATTHALESWRSHQDSIPWLLVLLSKTESTSPFVADVLAAAEKIPTSSPAYLTAFFHRMRLGNAARNLKEVRQSIGALLANPSGLPATARESLLDLRLDAASDLEDAIPLLARDSCEAMHESSGCHSVLAPHGATFLNNLPLELLVGVVHDAKLDPGVQTQIARKVWLRAVLLGRHDAAQSLDSFVQDPSAFPGNPPPENIAGWVKQYESAQTPEEKQFAAVFLLQHQFAVGISVDSDQPWCGSMDALDSTNSRCSVFPAMTVSSFLTEAQRKQAAAERVIFNNLDSQANYYTSVSIEYAQRHPDDPRVPESLSRAVKNTRMNCNNARTGALSKKAFDLLHNRYPNTSWAKNTKYWFGDSPY